MRCTSDVKVDGSMMVDLQSCIQVYKWIPNAGGNSVMDKHFIQG